MSRPRIIPQLQPQGSGLDKIGGPVLMNRAVASSQAPAVSTGNSEYRNQIFTYFTKAPANGRALTSVLYNGDLQWAIVTATLESAGPVVVGQSADLQPVLSGVGQLLETGIPLTFNIAKGQKLYIASTAINRVKVTIQADPWQEVIVGLLTRIASAR